MMTDIDEQLNKIATSETNTAIKLAAMSALSGFGLDRWMFASESPRAMFGMATLSTGFTFQWIGTYMAKGYLHIDPIVKHCRANSEPLLWDAVDGWEDAEPRVKVFMQDIRANGFGSGMAIPLSSPGGLAGILSVVSSQTLAETRVKYLQYMESASAIGKAMHSALERIMAN